PYSQDARPADEDSRGHVVDWRRISGDGDGTSQESVVRGGVEGHGGDGDSPPAVARDARRGRAHPPGEQRGGAVRRFTPRVLKGAGLRGSQRRARKRLRL